RSKATTPIDDHTSSRIERIYSKLDDMYRKQHVNFKAFMRAVDSINRGVNEGEVGVRICPSYSSAALDSSG
ncbi:unnamed protein product, partial [Trichogramma brassicae]